MLDHMYQQGILTRDSSGNWVVDLGSFGSYIMPDECRLQTRIGMNEWVDIIIRKGQYEHYTDVPGVRLHEGLPIRVQALQ